MANIATATYHVTGTREAVNNLWSVLQDMQVNDHDLHLADLARRFGIDCEKKQISTTLIPQHYYKYNFLST